MKTASSSPSRHGKAALTAFALLSALAIPLSAQTTYYWDPGSTVSTSGGGTGNWDTTDSFWYNGTVDTTWTSGSTSIASFGGTAGTVTLTSAIEAAGLVFTTTGYTINTGSNTMQIDASGINASTLSSGNTTITGSVALGAAQTWTVGSGATLAVSAVVSGSGNLTTAGSGTITLSGANTYTGNTTVGAGTTISLGNASALGSTSGALTLSGNASDINLNGFSVTKGSFSATTGTAVVTSSTAATLTINFQNTSSLYAGLSLTGAASLMLNGGTSTNNPFGTGAIVNGTGSIGFENQSGTIRVNSIAANLGANGTLLFNGTGQIAITSNAVTIGANNTIVVNGTANTFVFQPGTNGRTTTNGAWTGSGTITLSQGFQTPTFYFAGNMVGFAGTLILTSSGTTSNDGVQYAFSDSTAGQIGAGSAIITQQLNAGSVLNNTIQWNGTGNQTIAFGDLNTTGSAAYTSTGVNALSNATAGTTATFQVGGLNLSSTYGGNIVNGSGTVAITKVGTGTWTLTGNNTYTGGTVITGGTLSAGNASALGAGAVTINGGTLSATVNLTGITGFTLSSGKWSVSLSGSSISTGGITGSGTFTITGGTLDLSGSSGISYSTTYTILSGLTGSVSGLTITGYDTTDYTASLNSAGQLSFASAIPEPATYAAFLGLGVLGFAAWRRRRSNR